MLSEDQYLERTPDVIARVRKMREAAEKEMNRFTRVADYDVRRVVGRKSKEPPRPAVQLAFPISDHNAPQKPEPSAASQTGADLSSVSGGSAHDTEGV